MENITTSQITDLRQSAEYGKYLESLGWTVIGNNPQIFIRKLGILGAIAKIQRFSQLDWENTRSTLAKHHVWMTKFEPLSSPVSFPQDAWPMLATKTLRVNIAGTLEKILASFKKDCRYVLRKLEKKHFTPVINNYEGFYSIWKRAAGIKKLWTPSKKEFDSLVRIFRNKCFCVTIGDVAGCLVLIHKSIAYYYYSGALPEGKELDLPYLVVWECMKEAKRRHCTEWDFEGIYDDRWPNPGWQGFTHFKKSFGGYEVSFPGSYTKWF